MTYDLCQSRCEEDIGARCLLAKPPGLLAVFLAESGVGEGLTTGQEASVIPDALPRGLLRDIIEVGDLRASAGVDLARLGLRNDRVDRRRAVSLLPYRWRGTAGPSRGGRPGTASSTLRRTVGVALGLDRTIR